MTAKVRSLIHEQEDLERAWQQLGDQELILEAFVHFRCGVFFDRRARGSPEAKPATGL